ncbi:hypothetical protein GJAV_G00102600 [Gymnothorax javanicus]|nr:hypothetical protein GJAV_G00102600 [Gymnothorax javanicus]
MDHPNFFIHFLSHVGFIPIPPGSAPVPIQSTLVPMRPTAIPLKLLLLLKLLLFLLKLLLCLLKSLPLPDRFLSIPLMHLPLSFVALPVVLEILPPPVRFLLLPRTLRLPLKKTPTCVAGECPAEVPAYQSKHSGHPVVVTPRFPSGPPQPRCCPAVPSIPVPLSAPFHSDTPTSNSQMPNSNTPVSSLGLTGSDPPISVRSSDLIGSKLQTPPEVELQDESDLLVHPGNEDGSDCTQDTGNEGVPDPRIMDRRLLVPRVSLVQLPVSFPRPGRPLPQFLLKQELFSAGSKEFLLEQIPEEDQLPQLPSSDSKPVVLRVPLPSPPPEPPTQPPRVRKVRCAMCHQSGELKMCATCGRSFHEDCHLIPIGTNDSDRWRCIVCEDQLEVIVHQSTVSEDGGTLSLPDQKKCKRLFLTLIGKPYSTILYQQPEFVSDSVRYVDITLIRDRLLLKLSPPYLPSEFVSDVWLLLWSLPKSPKDNTRLEMLQRTFQKALRNTFGNSLHPSLLGPPPGKEGEVAKGDAISLGTKDRKKRKPKREEEEEAGPLKNICEDQGID